MRRTIHAYVDENFCQLFVKLIISCPWIMSFEFAVSSFLALSGLTFQTAFLTNKESLSSFFEIHWGE